jgi:hypothetical protein
LLSRVLIIDLFSFFSFILFSYSHVNQLPTVSENSAYAPVYPTLNASITNPANPFDDEDNDHDTSLTEKSTDMNTNNR